VHFYTSSDGGRLSPHPSGNVPVQIRLSNCLRIADSLCTAGGFSRTLLTFYLCFLSYLSKRQRAAPNSPFKPLVRFCTSSDGERL